MTRIKEPLNPNQLSILYALTKHGGKASFNHMLTEVGMDAGMFINTARLLIRKRLVKQGETFDVFEITPAGAKAIEKAMAKTTIISEIGIKLKKEEAPTSSKAKSSETSKKTRSEKQ